MLKSNKNKLGKRTLTAPEYANLFTDISVYNNENPNRFAAFFLRILFLLPCKTILKSNSISDYGNEIKLNKTNTRFALFVVCGACIREHFSLLI